MSGDSARRLGLVLGAFVITGCYASTPILPTDHPTKTWNLTVPAATASSGAIDQEGGAGNRPDEAAKKMHVPFWSPQDRANDADTVGKSRFSDAPEQLVRRPEPKGGVQVRRLRDIDSARYSQEPTAEPRESVPSRGQEKLLRYTLETIKGEGRALEGDALDVSGRWIRLKGIDAPEKSQTCFLTDGKPYDCGAEANRALASMIEGKRVTCSGDHRDTQGRLIAKCYADEVLINDQMVVVGYALADRDSGTEYITAENLAKRHSRGLWQGKFVAPWDWRRGVRRPSE